MKNRNDSAVQEKISRGGATAAGISGVIGSLPNVCHSICMSVVSVLSVFGITLNILPLMFLQTYRLYFWLAALAFTALSAYFYLGRKERVVWERNVLFINIGLLIFGIPFAFIADFMDFFRFVGGSIAVAGLLLLLFGKKLNAILIDPREVESLYRERRTSDIDPGTVANAADVPSISVFQFPKLTASSALFALVIGSFLINQFLMFRMNTMGGSNLAAASSTRISGTAMKLTAFDIALAKERMDKNNDGICDVCGMPVEQCIDAGQIDCGMVNNPQAIGTLGEAHDHADLRVYVAGQALDFAKAEYYMKSSLMHVDNNQDPEDASSVLHAHAKKVPLWLFFRSVGMNLTKDSLTLPDGRILKNETGNTLKFYLDGKKVDELGDYSFQPLDKLLISYGPQNDPDIQKQISSVTNFAKDHQK